MEGAALGTELGRTDGKANGVLVAGEALGMDVTGGIDGTAVGVPEGMPDGKGDCFTTGTRLGVDVGKSIGDCEGMPDGSAVGDFVPSSIILLGVVGSADIDGGTEGASGHATGG